MSNLDMLTAQTEAVAPQIFGAVTRPMTTSETLMAGFKTGMKYNTLGTSIARARAMDEMGYFGRVAAIGEAGEFQSWVESNDRYKGYATPEGMAAGVFWEQAARDWIAEKYPDRVNELPTAEEIDRLTALEFEKDAQTSEFASMFTLSDSPLLTQFAGAAIAAVTDPVALTTGAALSALRLYGAVRPAASMLGTATQVGVENMLVESVVQAIVADNLTDIGVDYNVSEGLVSIAGAGVLGGLLGAFAHGFSTVRQWRAGEIPTTGGAPPTARTVIPPEQIAAARAEIGDARVDEFLDSLDAWIGGYINDAADLPELTDALARSFGDLHAAAKEAKGLARGTQHTAILSESAEDAAVFMRVLTEQQRLGRALDDAEIDAIVHDTLVERYKPRFDALRDQSADVTLDTLTRQRKAVDTAKARVDAAQANAAAAQRAFADMQALRDGAMAADMPAYKAAVQRIEAAEAAEIAATNARIHAQAEVDAIDVDIRRATEAAELEIAELKAAHPRPAANKPWPDEVKDAQARHAKDIADARPLRAEAVKALREAKTLEANAKAAVERGYKDLEAIEAKLDSIAKTTDVEYMAAANQVTKLSTAVDAQTAKLIAAERRLIDSEDALTAQMVGDQFDKGVLPARLQNYADKVREKAVVYNSADPTVWVEGARWLGENVSRVYDLIATPRPLPTPTNPVSNAPRNPQRQAQLTSERIRQMENDTDMKMILQADESDMFVFGGESLTRDELLKRLDEDADVVLSQAGEACKF